MNIFICTLSSYCVVCPNPKSPANGKVKLQRPVATFTCNEGYKLNGRRTMHCTVFGWSPRYPPTCIPCKIINMF